jgi:leucyl aminopeptidase
VNLVVLIPLTENMITDFIPMLYKAVAEAGLAVNLVVLIPLTENMITDFIPIYTRL